MKNNIEAGNKKQLSGKVLESKMKDTAVIRVERRFPINFVSSNFA